MIREVSKEEYWSFLHTHPEANYQQTPEWGEARAAHWKPELIGWFDQESHLCGAAVLRYRRIRTVDKWFVFIPQGPLLDWSDPHVSDQLSTLVDYLRERDVFGVRMTPVVSLRTWDAFTIKAGLADPNADRISDLEPTEVSTVGTGLITTLSTAGWRAVPTGTQSDASHPRFNFWLPLKGRSEAAVLAGMNKSWRRNIRKAEQDGLKVALGSRDDLSEIYRIYGETARRNRFSAQPESYFEAMWDCLGAGFQGRFNLFIAYHEGRAMAANATAQVGGWAQGVFAATSTEHPHIKPSNALNWAEIRQAIADGAELFDLGGVDDTLDTEDPAAGLVRFKAGMGAEAHEYIGAWDLPIQLWVYAAFTRALPLYSAARDLLRRGTARVATLHRG